MSIKIGRVAHRVALIIKFTVRRGWNHLHENLEADVIGEDNFLRVPVVTVMGC